MEKRQNSLALPVGRFVTGCRNSGKKVLVPAQSETEPKADELRQLRKQSAQLRMENDISKKVAVYFAKESL